MGRQTIAVDIDDVLAANAEGFVEYSNKKWGTKLKPDDYDEHWAEMWGIDYDEENRRRDMIVKDKVFVSYRFFDEAKPVLKKLAKKYKLVIVSSRSHYVSVDTTEWLRKEFGDIFSEIHYAKIWNDPSVHTKEKVKLTKAELCKEIGADYLIDDQPKHCIAAAEAGIQALLFGNYAWTRRAKPIPGMTRVKNWQAVEKYFDEQS